MPNKIDSDKIFINKAFEWSYRVLTTSGPMYGALIRSLIFWTMSRNG